MEYVEPYLNAAAAVTAIIVMAHVLVVYGLCRWAGIRPFGSIPGILLMVIAVSGLLISTDALLVDVETALQNTIENSLQNRTE